MSDVEICLLPFRQAHREEVVTMIASPANDQVISAGYGELTWGVLRVARCFCFLFVVVTFSGPFSA